MTRIRTEDALRESEERYRKLVHYAPAGIYDVDFTTGRFTEVNDAMCRILGYTRDELLAMTAFNILDDEGKARFASRIRRAQSGDQLDEVVEYGVLTKEGRLIWAILNTKFHWKGGKIVGATVVAHDVTLRKWAEEERELLVREVKMQAAEMEAIFKAQNDAVLIYDTEMNVRRVNPAFFTTYGFDPVGLHAKEVIRRTSSRSLDGRPLKFDERPTPRALHGEKVSGALFRVTKADGTEGIVETSAGPMRVGRPHNRLCHGVAGRDQTHALRRGAAGKRREIQESCEICPCRSSMRWISGVQSSSASTRSCAKSSCTHGRNCFQ